MQTGALRWHNISDNPAFSGVACNDNGVTLAGVPLIFSTAAGFQPQPFAAVRFVLARAYDHAMPDAAIVHKRLGTVARALTAGDKPGAKGQTIPMDPEFVKLLLSITQTGGPS